MRTSNSLPPAILREDNDIEDIKKENIPTKEAGENNALAIACANIFNAVWEEEEIEPALDVLANLQKEILPDQINIEIKNHIKDHFNTLEPAKNPASVLNFIKKVFDIVFDIDVKETLQNSLDLYKKALQEVIEEHILQQIEVTFALFPKIKMSLIRLFPDFFAGLKVSPLDDDEKNRILMEILKGFMLNDYAKVIDLTIDFGFIEKGYLQKWLAEASVNKQIPEKYDDYNPKQKFIKDSYMEDQEKTRKKWKEWNHLETTLSKIQRLLRKFRRFNLDKHITRRENEIFYREVTHRRLVETCAFHLDYLSDTEKLEAAQSYQKIYTFYDALIKDKEFTKRTIEKRKEEIETLKIKIGLANQDKVIPENELFINILNNIVSEKFAPEENYLEKLVNKSLSLNILRQQKLKAAVKQTTSWSEEDDKSLQIIFSGMQQELKELTVETFLDALIENEKKGKSRVRISHQCIDDFVEYLEFMEEIYDFDTMLYHLSGKNDERMQLMMTHELAKMPQKILNNMLQKIKPYCTLATQYSKTGEKLSLAKRMLNSIKTCIEKINKMRYEEGIDRENEAPLKTIRLRKGLIDALKNEKVMSENKSVFVMQKQQNKDAVFMMSRLSYIPKPKPSQLDDKRTFLNRLKTVNALKSSCEVFQKELSNRIDFLLSDDIKRQFAGAFSSSRKYENYFAGSTVSNHHTLITQILDAFLRKNKLITNLIKGIDGLGNVLLCYGRLTELQACLADDSSLPYDRALSFEATFSQCKSIIQQENTPAAQKFLAAVVEKQDNDVVLHQACKVFESEMGEKVKSMLLNESKKSKANELLYKSYDEVKGNDSLVNVVLNSYHSTTVTPQNIALKALLAKNKELTVSLQKYEIAVDMKQNLSYYRMRPQKAVDIFERKLKKYMATLKKYEDSPLIKFFQAIKQVFGFVPKPTPTETFFAKTKDTLFKMKAESNTVKEINPEKRIDYKKR